MNTVTAPTRTEAPAPLPASARLSPGDVIRVGLVGVRGRPLRACLSALGIAIGIAAMVAILGITAGSQAQIEAQIAKVGTNLLTATTGQDPFGTKSELPAESATMVSRIAPVRQVSAVGTVSNATVHRNDKTDQRDTAGIAVQATRLDLPATIGATIAKGTWLNAATEQYPAVVLGSVAADRFGIHTPGTAVYLGGQWFTVAGILSPVTLAPEIDRSALIGWDAAAKLGFDGHPTTIYVRSADEAVNDVHDVLAQTVNPQHPEQVNISRPSDALTTALAVKNTFKLMFLGLGAIALLVGGIGVANTMVISVLERRAEIGLRRAIGAGRGQIKLQFLTESVALSALGGISGVVIGLAVSVGWALNQNWPVTIPTQAVLAGVGAAVTIGALAGLYPATRAARTSPAEALASS
ncbi:ABC transporter permease [Streptomyces sp. NBC_00250]|uniref:ABC transporter permease n=1 Tax=unclassified Streptomyces TaxID=2593676 RepID=UPI00225B0627|nr:MULTISPECIES: ABC transporter permease [unclassified Streptomyces]MCX5126863.1 ABC transporter permease [Streptomyces sp. NBC_00347]